MLKKNLIILLLFSFGLTNFSPALAQDKVQITAIQKEKLTNKVKEKIQKEQKPIQAAFNSESKSLTSEKEPKLSYKAKAKLKLLRLTEVTILATVFSAGMMILASACISSEL